MQIRRRPSLYFVEIMAADVRVFGYYGATRDSANSATTMA